MNPGRSPDFRNGLFCGGGSGPGVLMAERCALCSVRVKDSVDLPQDARIAHIGYSMPDHYVHIIHYRGIRFHRQLHTASADTSPCQLRGT